MNDNIIIDDDPSYSKYSRWYCEPCFGKKEQINDICEELTKNKNGLGSITLEFYINTRQNSRNTYSLAIFEIVQNISENDDVHFLSADSIGLADSADKCDDEKEAIYYDKFNIDDDLFDRLTLFDQLQEKLKKINPSNKLKSLQDNELSFPKIFFSKIKSTIPLRICTSTPNVSGDRYIFTFSNIEERNAILKNFEYFAKNENYTHFLALPVAPNFPEWTEAMKNILSRWGVNVKDQLKKTHITLSLFVIKSEDELNLVNQIVDETMKEIEWPEDNSLIMPKANCFGTQNRAKILFIEPEQNVFIEYLSKFILSFVSKMNDKGFGYIEEDSKSLHITMIRPNFVTNGYTFDASKYISDLREDELPTLRIQELRLVQRFAYDDDGFYKTIFHYPLYDNEKNNDENKNE